MRPERPPRIAAALLARMLPARRRETILGDLEEDWRRRADAGRPARLWYWHQALALAIGYRRWRRDHGLGGRTGVALDALRHDLAGAARHLVRAPRFAASATLLLAAGIAVATALFSIVDSTLLAPLPYREPERLVRLHEAHAESGVLAGPVAPGNFLDLRRRATGLDGLAASYTSEAALTGREPVESIRIGIVTGDFFGMLGVEPLLGRTFLPEEVEGARLDNAGRFVGPARIVLSERVWRDRFGADRAIAGRSIGVNGQQVLVVGVVPSSVRLPEPDVGAWVAWDPTVSGTAEGAPSRNARFVDVTGRLADDVTLTAARSEIEGLGETLALAYPRTNAGWSATLRPLDHALTDGLRRPLALLAAAVGLLLLGICASLAGMQVARAAARTQEIAVRAALGAARRRLTRQLLLESLLLALVATGLGLGAARVTLGGVLPLIPSDLPRPIGEGLTPTVIAAALLVGLLVGAATGLLTAFRSLGVNPVERLRTAGGRTSPAEASGRWLVVAEIALAVALVAVSGLLARSFGRLLSEDPGFEPNGVLTARLNLEAGVSAAGGSRVAFFEALLDELRAEPGVLSAAGATFLPMTGIGPDFDRPYWRSEEPEPGGNAPRGWIRIVTPGMFETIGIRLRAGRPFTADDRFDFEAPAGEQPARVAVVNRTLAERSWPEGAVGRTLVMDYPGAINEYEIVGVVEDVRSRRLGEPAPAAIYLPYGQIPYPGLTLAIRTRDHPPAFAPRLRTIVSRLNPLQPVDRVATLESSVASTVQRERFVLALIAAFGVSALVLAALGVYGLVDLLVRRRTRELGIRLALGAEPEQLRRLVLGTAASLAGAGLLLGIGATLAGSRWLEASLYRTSPLDPLALGVTATTIGIAAIAAAWRPALRATRVDPADALRTD